MVPAAAGSNVGQLHLMPLVAVCEPLTQRNNCRMQPKLQDSGYPAAGVALDLREFIDVAWIEDERLFTNRVGAGAHDKPAMGVMKVIRRADRPEIDLLPTAAKQVYLAVELLELNEEFRIRKVTIQNTHR